MGLPQSYPMVAPNYAAARSALAKQIGLGQLAKGRWEAEVGTHKSEDGGREAVVAADTLQGAADGATSLTEGLGPSRTVVLNHVGPIAHQPPYGGPAAVETIGV